MAFKFTDDLIATYYTHGYAIFRQIMPPALIEDLRRQTDKLRELARSKHGRQVQRLQLRGEHGIAVDVEPFRPWAALPEFCDATQQLLSPLHTPALPHSVLLEPADRPYTIGWHRDWRDNTEVGEQEWRKVVHNIDFFNQVNAALYDDSSLWIVPGSHFRDDLPSEQAAARDGSDVHGVFGTAEAKSFSSLTGTAEAEYANRGGSLAEYDLMPDAEREQRGLRVCRRMPGAMRVELDAGDIAIYRNTLWHNGTYVPYKRRATLHGSIDTPAYVEWYTAHRVKREEQREAAVTGAGS